MQRRIEISQRGLCPVCAEAVTQARAESADGVSDGPFCPKCAAVHSAGLLPAATLQFLVSARCRWTPQAIRDCAPPVELILSFGNPNDLRDSTSRHAVALATAASLKIPVKAVAVIRTTKRALRMALPCSLAERLVIDFRAGRLLEMFGSLAPTRAVLASDDHDSGKLRGMPDGVLRREHLAPTQFVSALFYTLAFVGVGLHFNPLQTNVGHFTTQDFAAIQEWDPHLVAAAKFMLLWGIMAANAVRYYLSFWSIEESGIFGLVRTWSLAQRGALHTGAVAEWYLRVGGLISLHAIPVTVGQNGHLLEVFLVLFFASQCLWDLLALALIKQYAGSSKARNTSALLGDVRDWLWMESLGLAFACAYALAAYAGQPPIKLIFTLALGAVSVLVAINDIVRLNRRKYQCIFFPLVAGSVCASFVIYFID